MSNSNNHAVDGTDNRRNMEDFVTWVDSSKIKRNIMKYRDKLDDFELEAL